MKMIGKKFKTLAGLALAALVLATPRPAAAQQTFSTVVYLDWTQFLTNDGYKTSDAKSDYFAFRRAYFTYENKINDHLKFRFRLDADNTANLTSVGVNFTSDTLTTKSDDKLRPFIKNLYMEYSDLFPGSTIRIGMTDTLTFKVEEDKWGYRSVAKTLMDGYKDITGVDIDATSADIGASLTGSLTKFFRYGFMVSNGSGYAHLETDKYKKYMFQGQLIPVAGLSLVGYVDYEKQTAAQKAITYKFDGYFEMVRNLVVGGEWFSYKNDKNVTNSEIFKVSGWSVFSRYSVTPDKLGVFARYDYYEPNNLVANNELRLAIAGVDWAPFGTTVKFQPNISYYNYSDPSKKDDAYFNMTFCLAF